MEDELQKHFADLFGRIMKNAQADLETWQGSPFRELVAGIAPRSVPGLIVRCLAALLDAQGLSAKAAGRGDSAHADIIIGASGPHYLKTATIQDATQSPRFRFHALEVNHATILIGIAPRKISGWVIQSHMIAQLTKEVPVARRIEVDPAKVPWSGGAYGDGTLSGLCTKLEKG